MLNHSIPQDFGMIPNIHLGISQDTYRQSIKKMRKKRKEELVTVELKYEISK